MWRAPRPALLGQPRTAVSGPRASPAPPHPRPLGPRALPEAPPRAEFSRALSPPVPTAVVLRVVEVERWRSCCRCLRCTSEASEFTRFGSHVSKTGGCALSGPERRGTWEDSGARSDPAPPGSGPWRTFSSQISGWGGTLVLGAAAGRGADPREVAWGRQREVDEERFPSPHFDKAVAALTF